jgi:large subunit ribosomal protein L6
MSRIGKKPVPLPSGVSATVAGRTVQVRGPKGELTFQMPDRVSAGVSAELKVVSVTRDGEDRSARALHGMTRAIIANMVKGVSDGYERRLLIYGTGYGCTLVGKRLHLNCGFMGRGGKDKPQFALDVPDGLQVQVEAPASRGDTDPAKVVVRGCDKHLVGQFAANIRRIRPPEPYKGKGIRYEGEVVRRKAGKAFASGSGG